MQLRSVSADMTERLGRLLGSLLAPADFIALRGDLGGGKTCLTRGIVAAVAPDSARLVASPTFAIMNSYPGQPPVYHFDFYRLGGDDDIAELGFEEYFQGDGVAIVEWSERLDELLPGDRLTIDFEYAGEDERLITLSASGPRSQGLLQRFCQLAGDEDFL